MNTIAERLIIHNGWAQIHLPLDEALSLAEFLGKPAEKYPRGSSFLFSWDDAVQKDENYRILVLSQASINRLPDWQRSQA